jgi:alpha-galactosidase
MTFSTVHLINATESEVVWDAQYLNTSGLAAIGYNTIAVDAGWTATSRTSSGDLQENTNQFPHGIPWLVSVLRTNGCYLGLYTFGWHSTTYLTSIPNLTTSPLSAYADGCRLARWGIRWWKIDGGGYFSTAMQYAFEQAAAGLDDGAAAVRSDYPVYLQGVINEPYPLRPWMSSVLNGIYSVSFGGDPSDASPTDRQAFLMDFLKHSALFTVPGCTLNPEGISHASGSSWWNTNYARADMGVFCLGPFQLMLTSLTDPALFIYTNRAAILINQDPLVAPGLFISTSATQNILYRPLANGDVALGLWNLSTNSNTSFTVMLSTVPGLRTNYVHVLDVFDHNITYANGTLSATVNAGGFNLYRLSQ